MTCSHVVASCKHVHHEYRNYIHLMYTLESVSNVYKRLFGELHNKVYWQPYHEPMISPDLEKKRSIKGYPIFTRIHTEMDIRKTDQLK